MRYLQPLAIVLLLALAIADHWPSRDADAALPMSAYATKQGVCRVAQRLDIELAYWAIASDDLRHTLSELQIQLPSMTSCNSLFR